MLRAPSSTRREFNRNINEEIATTGLSSFQQENLFTHPLYLGTLMPGDINESILRPLNYLDFLTTLATKNGMALLITNPVKGYKLLSENQVAAFTEGARATDIPGADATDAEKKLFRETLASIASSQTALASNDEKLEKRAADAGFLLQEAVQKIIKTESIAHLVSRSKQGAETDYYDQLVLINDYVKTFTLNTERISVALDKLVDEISIARSYSEASRNIAQFEEVLRLNIKYLSHSVVGADGIEAVLPIDSDHPPRTNKWIIGKLEKKMSDRHPLSKFRDMVTAAKNSDRPYSHLANRLRKKMEAYESNTPSQSTTLVRGNIASASAYEQDLDSQSYGDRTDYYQGVQARWNETYGDVEDVVDEVGDQHSSISTQAFPVTAMLGQRKASYDQYGVDQQRQRVNEYERPFQPQHMAAAAGSAYQAPQLCLHYQRGNCSYGDRCSNLHEIPGSIDVKMSASEYQQYQQSKLAGQQRSIGAANHHQQGSYPSLHPSGAYAARPPQPPGVITTIYY